ncbi:HAD family hydrolase [Bizionia argentinensis]|nr:HAD hydrolase-like protein [Bizionia argentinensis]
MKNILWDFDGVILDSMEVRDFGFKEIFKNFNEEQISLLIKYHRDNGGLSRYVKIRYFFETILNKDTTEKEINEYALKFSEIMRKELTNSQNLIMDSLNFIKQNHSNYNFHIVSGSDQEELRFLCHELNLSSYFISIHGSPIPKITLVKKLIKEHGYLSKETCLMGDSINDYEAAHSNGISFYAYNNKKLKEKGFNYIEEFKVFSFNT